MSKTLSGAVKFFRLSHDGISSLEKRDVLLYAVLHLLLEFVHPALVSRYFVFQAAYFAHHAFNNRSIFAGKQLNPLLNFT